MLALLWMNSAFATLVTFEDRTNIPTANGEVVGTEWISRGLLLTTPSLALNVGSFLVDFGSDAMLGLRFNVPEPAPLGMLLLGLLGVVMVSKRRRCA